MTIYQVVIEKKARRALLSLNKKQQARIVGAIELLARNPLPPAARKLRNRDGFRVRDGDYRVIYTINDTLITIVVLAIGHRGDVYSG